MEQIWGPAIDIEFNGKLVTIQTTRKEILNNGWIEFGAKSEDNTFIEVFGKNPIPIAIKPKQPFKPQYDLFQNKPEQIDLCKQIWDAIQQQYF
jgi:hypothetical protein